MAWIYTVAQQCLLCSLIHDKDLIFWFDCCSEYGELAEVTPEFIFYKATAVPSSSLDI